MSPPSAAVRRERYGGRLLRCVLAAVVLAGTLVLGAGTPAQAHALLVGSDPVEGAVLETAPADVRLTFSESVTAVPDAVAVFDADGGPVDSSAASADEVLTVSLDEEVAEGTLVVVWRVVSADGHPVSGSLTFSVGAASAAVTDPPVASVPDDGVVRPPWLLAPLRWAGYLGLLLTVGVVVFVLLALPRAREADGPRRRLLRLAVPGAAVTAAAWLFAVPVVAAYQVGGGAGALTRGATWSALPATEYLVAGAVAAGTVAAVLLARASGGSRRGAPLAAGGVALAAPALTGHSRAASPEVLVVAADVLHLLAGGLWLGGLVGLALSLGALAGRGDLAALTLSRFSVAASGVLAVLVVTGSLMSWRIVGSWAGLVETTFGRLLLAKVALVLVAVGMAAWNRWSLLPRLERAERRRDRRAGVRPVVRATAAEAVVLVAVLAVTAVLVDRSPDAAPAGAGSAGEALDPAYVGPHLARLGELEVQAGVSPHVAGPNDLTILLRDGAGVPTAGYEAPRVSLATDGVDLGAVELTEIAPGTYTAEVVLPRPGIWELQVSLRVSEFENPVTTLEFGVS